MLELIKLCKETNDWTQLIRAVGKVFADPEMLLNSFNKSKEEIRSMDVDLDKEDDEMSRGEVKDYR